MNQPLPLLRGISDERNRKEGFLTGKDDYITKPFTIPELNAPVMRVHCCNYDLCLGAV